MTEESFESERDDSECLRTMRGRRFSLLVIDEVGPENVEYLKKFWEDGLRREDLE